MDIVTRVEVVCDCIASGWNGPFTIIELNEYFKYIYAL